MKKLLLILLSVFLFSCTGVPLEQARKVKVGMTTKEVEAIMGEPFQTRLESDKNVCHYWYKSGPWIEIDMVVYYVDGVVTEFY